MLMLGDNQLSNLHDSICKELKGLYLKKNQLRKLPKLIGNL